MMYGAEHPFVAVMFLAHSKRLQFSPVSCLGRSQTERNSSRPKLQTKALLHFLESAN